jgi:hypothetical protein
LCDDGRLRISLAAPWLYAKIESAKTVINTVADSKMDMETIWVNRSRSGRLTRLLGKHARRTCCPPLVKATSAIRLLIKRAGHTHTCSANRLADCKSKALPTKPDRGGKPMAAMAKSEKKH